ncbi:MAG: hypothetical protein ACK53L_11040 [Pirellulaceae bacterium]|jgi:hypothetical protein
MQPASDRIASPVAWNPSTSSVSSEQPAVVPWTPRVAGSSTVAVVAAVVEFA